MREYIRHGLMLLGFGLFFTGCEVGITPLEKSFNEAGVATSAEVTENGDIGTISIDIQEGVDSNDLDVEVEIYGEGSKNFTIKLDKTASAYIGKITQKDGITVTEDTTYHFYARTIVNGQKMCAREVQKTIYKAKGLDSNPTITLNGDKIVYYTLTPDNNYYTDAGASAVNALDEDISSEINTTVKWENDDFEFTEETLLEKDWEPTSIGKYIITYRVQDTAGNTAKVTRTVIVKESAISGNKFRLFIVDNIENEKAMMYANTSDIVNMDGLFMSKVDFNYDISDWNTSNVTSMNNMFNGASSFNQDLSGWDVSHVQSHENFAKDSGLKPEYLPHFPE